MADAGKETFKLLWKKWWGNQKVETLRDTTTDSSVFSLFLFVVPSGRVYSTNYKMIVLMEWRKVESFTVKGK